MHSSVAEAFVCRKGIGGLPRVRTRGRVGAAAGGGGGWQVWDVDVDMLFVVEEDGDVWEIGFVTSAGLFVCVGR